MKTLDSMFVLLAVSIWGCDSTPSQGILDQAGELRGVSMVSPNPRMSCGFVDQQVFVPCKDCILECWASLTVNKDAETVEGVYVSREFEDGNIIIDLRAKPMVDTYPIQNPHHVNPELSTDSDRINFFGTFHNLIEERQNSKKVQDKVVLLPDEFSVNLLFSVLVGTNATPGRTQLVLLDEPASSMQLQCDRQDRTYHLFKSDWLGRPEEFSDIARQWFCKVSDSPNSTVEYYGSPIGIVAGQPKADVVAFELLNDELTIWHYQAIEPKFVNAVARRERSGPLFLDAALSQSPTRIAQMSAPFDELKGALATLEQKYPDTKHVVFVSEREDFPAALLKSASSYFQEVSFRLPEKLESSGGEIKVDVRARIETGVPNIGDFCDPANVRRVVNQHQTAFKYCFEKEFQSNPTLSGKITAQWKVNQEGAVIEPTIAETTMNGRAVEECITRVISRLRFEQSKGGICIVQYPFVLNSGLDE